MNDVLLQILANKRLEVEQAKADRALSEQLAVARDQGAPRGFARALAEAGTRGDIAVIAEIKKASPSKGLLRENFDPVEIARAYETANATCLSVLTDRDYFMGADEHLVAARATVALPVLRKDFIIDSYQVVQSRAIGADCILLIAAALDVDQLRDLADSALELGLDVLVEIHDESELACALAIPQAMIGINNRNLRTFETDVEISRNLARLAPKNRLLISESGISNFAQIQSLRAEGISAFLVGETLMRARDPGVALQLLTAG